MVMDMKKHKTLTIPGNSQKTYSVYYSQNGDLSGLDTNILGIAYPNPTNQHIKLPIFITGKNTNLKLLIYDQYGKRVVTENRNISGDQHEVSIDLEEQNLGAGVYLLKATMEGKKYFYRIIKR